MKTTDNTELYEIISKLDNRDNVEDFLNILLTESEIEDILKRWNILKRLSLNEPQREISKSLSVSLCKVTRGSKMLKNENSIIRKILFDERWR